MTQISERPHPEDMVLASQEARDVLKAYNPQTREWSLSAKGEFWDAVRSAHLQGLTGKGKRIAIVDTCPDMSVPQLSEQLVVHNLTGDAPHSHGTAVALLLSSIAFEAEIHHYVISEGGIPKRQRFEEAMMRLEADPVDYVCLSLGDIQSMQDPDVSWAEPLMRSGDMVGLAERFALDPLITPVVRQCYVNPCTCALVERVSATGAIVLAAAGNQDGSKFCPARSPGTVSIGFQGVTSTFKDGAQIKAWAKPEGMQSDWVNYTVLQPPGVIGSSFATPIMVGALALREDGADLDQLLRIQELSQVSKFSRTLVDRFADAGAEGEDVYRHVLGDYERVLDMAFSPFPHVDGGDLTPTQILEAGLFMVAPAVNMALVLLEHGRLGKALKVFGWAKSVAPWLAPAHANWAATLVTDARYRLDTGQGDLAAVAANLDAAEEAYETALQLEKDSPAYLEGLANVTALKVALGAARGQTP